MSIPPPDRNGERLCRLPQRTGPPEIIEVLTALVEQHDDIVEFNIGRSPCILVNSAAQVRALFFEHEACLRKPEFVKTSNRGHWGDGLTTLEGDAWRRHRRLLQPCFNATAISSWLTVVAQCTADMLDAWAPGSDGDLVKELRILTARIAARIVLDAELEGYQFGEGRSGVLPLAEAYGEDFAISADSDSRASLAMVRPRAPRRMDAAVGVIDARLASGEQRGDVLSSLIRQRLPNGENLTRDEILGEVIQMLYAGHLTIPHTLVNFLHDVAANGLAAKIAAEARHVCATGSPTAAVLSKSNCFAALKESMRLHPAAPILYREANRPFELSEFTFPHGVGVWVSPQLLHNDARNFPEPHRFAPERFLRGHLAATSAPIYLPFGLGRRSCIGSQIALHEMTLIALLMISRLKLVRE
jgi:cytochrome P450